MNISELVKKQEKYYDIIKERQNLNEDSIWYGEFYDNVNIIEQALPLYISEESKYYKSKELLDRMKLNLDFFLRMQFPNGLLSLWNCNIISPPDTAFNVYPLSLCLDLIEKVNMPELDTLKEKIYRFLKNVIPGLVLGGFHTPNHRWIISCALALLYKRFKDESIKSRVYEFIGEGIDINNSGEWTERSNGGYNSMVDAWCYHIAEVFNEESFFDAVRKNLNMMKYMLHPEDYIVTEYSARQDRAQKIKMSSYAIPYLLMACMDNDKEFSYLADLCIENSKSLGRLLVYCNLYEAELAKKPPCKQISESYTVLLNENNLSELRQKHSIFGDTVLRYRKDKLSITVMAGQQEFMFVQYGKARACSIKLPIGWFGIGGVDFSQIKRISETKFTLSTQIYGDYFQTLNSESVKEYNGNYIKMPNDQRERIGCVETNAEITIELKDNGVDLNISVDKMPYIFTQLVIGFDSDGEIEGEGIVNLPNGAFLPTDGKARYIIDSEWIEVEGEANSHNYDVIRGDIYNKHLKNLVFNALSPKDWKIKFRCGEYRK